MERVIVEEMACFMNADGGTLFIGVEDTGKMLGLGNDYQVFSKRRDKDAYENWLMQLLLNEFGQDTAPLLSVTFPKVDGVEICRVDVAPAPKPMYTKDGAGDQFLIRAGNAKKRLSTRETVEYVKQRWG